MFLNMFSNVFNDILNNVQWIHLSSPEIIQVSNLKKLGFGQDMRTNKITLPKNVKGFFSWTKNYNAASILISGLMGEG